MKHALYIQYLICPQKHHEAHVDMGNSRVLTNLPKVRKNLFSDKI